MSTSRSAVVAATLFVALPQGTSAQIVQINPATGCPACRVIVDSLFTLRAGPQNDPIDRSQGVMDGSGRFYQVAKSRTRILVFNQRGRVVNEFGQIGDGPGEVRRITAIALGLGDSLFVFDQSRRVVVFDSAQRFRRTFRLPAAVSKPSILASGKIAAYVSATNRPGGQRIHIYSPTGDLVKTLGRRFGPERDPLCPMCDDNTLGGTTGDSIWLVTTNRYELSSWAADGRSLNTLVVAGSDWFQDWRDVPRLDGTQQVNPTVLDVFADAKGRLWVRGLHAPPNWRPHPITPADSLVVRSNGSVAAASADAFATWRAKYERSDYETVFDIVDLQRNRLITSSRFPGIIGILGPTTGFRFRRTEDGETEVDILRFRFVEH